MTNTLKEDQLVTSIIGRQEIDAPDTFVSVFHETSSAALPSIDQLGLRVDQEDRSHGMSGDFDLINRYNNFIDQDRPERWATLGVSRVSSIYAYPKLEDGHGLHGADQRFVARSDESLAGLYESYRKYGGPALKAMGVESQEEFIRLKKDPDYLRKEHPGEILELKVDPTRVFVGDLETVTNLFGEIRRWGYEPGNAKQYWDDVISLADFLKYYKKPQFAEDGNNILSPEQFREGERAMPGRYCPVVGVPEGMPYQIVLPEILIPDNVPQEHLRLVV